METHMKTVTFSMAPILESISWADLLIQRSTQTQSVVPQRAAVNDSVAVCVPLLCPARSEFFQSAYETSFGFIRYTPIIRCVTYWCCVRRVSGGFL